MTDRLRLAVTADLHWGTNPRGDAATRELLAFLAADPPDILVLAGDVGAASRFEECLALFRDLPGRKALVPGNHDIWVETDDRRGDSLEVYRQYLPWVCEQFDFAYLDREPLVLPEADLALVGSINWYDYSWSIDRLREQLVDWQERLARKTFSRGRHNDARFVRWPLDDARFTAEVVATLAEHLDEALTRVSRAVVVTHHPPFQGLSFPITQPGPPSTDRLLWEAFSGNRALEEVLGRFADRIPFAFCGHTHRQRDSEFHGIRGYNIGGDYHFKRLLTLDWPDGNVDAHVFGDPTPPPGRG
jgi:predicted phosphohydrolase